MMRDREYKAIIDYMGAEGEGAAYADGRAIYVPFTLPQEQVEISVPERGAQGRLLAVEKPSAQRQEPLCRHFGMGTECGQEAQSGAKAGEKTALPQQDSPLREKPLSQETHSARGCGGCLLQHWQAEPYQAWKRSLIGAAFARAGVEADLKIKPLFPCAPYTRRRLVLSAANKGGKAVLGFNRYRRHEIINIEECPIAAPELTAALPFIRALLLRLKPRRDPFHIVATLAENGLDIALQGLGGLAEEEKLRLTEAVLKGREERPAAERGSAPSGIGRRQDSSAAAAANIVRLTADAEIIISLAAPLINFGGVEAELPSGGFLQAARGAEAKMARLAAQALHKCKNIIDLFAGSGSFTFRLAANSAIHAVEWDKAALASLEQAAARARSRQTAESGAAEGGAVAGAARKLKKITAERRDLFRRPLTHKELAAYDGLIFDPPRAGAEAQAREIAKAQLKTVVAVSCNPATLARDVGILLAGGYILESIAPIDQFLWSPHLEAVAVLTKPRPRKSWTL